MAPHCVCRATTPSEWRIVFLILQACQGDISIYLCITCFRNILEREGDDSPLELCLLPPVFLDYYLDVSGGYDVPRHPCKLFSWNCKPQIALFVFKEAIVRLFYFRNRSSAVATSASVACERPCSFRNRYFMYSSALRSNVPLHMTKGSARKHFERSLCATVVSHVGTKNKIIEES